MSEKIVFAGEEISKSRAVALAANSFIDELLYRARRETGIYDYYDIAVLGYSGDGVESLLSPAGEFIKPSRLAVSDIRRENITRERRLPDGRSVLATTAQNMWIEPKAAGTTPMKAALRDVLTLAEGWCRRAANAKSYPPTVLNITDGEASDGGPDDIGALAARLRATGTADGATLLINIHLWRSDADSPAVFPASPDELPENRYARLLYDISSEMPDGYRDMIARMKPGATGPFRGMSFNCPLNDLVAMMNIGSINSIML